MRWRAAVVAAAVAAALSAAATACISGGASGGSGVTEPVVIAGGGTTGIYYSYGGELAAALSSRFDVDAEALETGGSIENLQLLTAGTAQVAFSAADAAADAVAGQDPFDGPLPVQAIARVYDDFVHLVVPADSAIRSIEDLRGRDVSLGAVGSGTELIAARLLNAADIDRNELTNVELGIDGSIEAMLAGEIDAFFWSGGLPTPGVNELAEELPIRLIDLWGLVEAVRAIHGGGYRHGVVPQGTYGLEDDVATMAVPNFLMVHADATDEMVHDLVSVLFEERAEIALQVPAAALLDRPRAIHTEPVDLHPGAVQYYRDTKL
jgi:TRAP transporter TAXI family solute receptor